MVCFKVVVPRSRRHTCPHGGGMRTAQSGRLHRENRPAPDCPDRIGPGRGRRAQPASGQSAEAHAGLDSAPASQAFT